MIFSFPFKTQAASLYILSSNQTVNVGSEFTLTIKVDTSSKNINNAEGIISYPSNLVDVISLSKSSSIFNLWITEPTNSSGSVAFNGGVKTPGFNGSGGTIFSVKFRAKKVGVAQFSISDDFIRENDGLGTNILTGQSGVSVNIIGTAVAPKEEAPVVENAKTTNSERLVVFSDTHPDQEKWYALKDAHFYWDNPEGVLAISTLLDTKSDSYPSTKSTLVVSDKTKTNIKDGINYFHVIYKTKAGWSRATHYMVRVDTTPPKNLMVEYNKDSDGKHFLSLKGEDDLSGINFYRVTIPGHESFVVPAIGGCATYDISEMMNFGKNTIKIEAVDFAGNIKEKMADITVDTLEKPVITSYTKDPTVGDVIQINGKTSYPSLETYIYTISPNGKISKYFVTPNEKGELSMFTDKVAQKGNYTAWIKVYSDDGTKYVESNYVDINARFSLWNYILTSPLLLGSILFFIFSLAILILAIYLLRLHKNKVVELKKPTTQV